MNRAPVGVLRRLRGLQRSRARVRHRVRSRLRPEEGVRSADLAAALRKAGLSAGDGVFFQASMSPFGQIAGGPTAVLEALDEVLGPDALIAMPAFPFSGSVLEYLRGNPCFRLRTTPSAMGAVSELFRKQSGTARSLHPTHSVCARGPGSDALLAGHELVVDPFGPDTPLARMVDRKLHQVWFGTDIHAFTMYHVFEGLVGDRFPIDVFLDDPVAVRCEDAAGRELTVHTLVHDPKVAGYRIRSDARQEVRRELLAEGVVRAVPLGASEILVGELSAIFTSLHRLLERGLTIYDIETHALRER